MGTRTELKIFRKSSIEYLMKLNSKSMSYIFDMNNWDPTAKDSNGDRRILRQTRKSLKRFGDEMNIFKAPVIVGLKIIYYKSFSFVFENNCTDPSFDVRTESETENY